MENTIKLPNLCQDHDGFPFTTIYPLTGPSSCQDGISQPPGGTFTAAVVSLSANLLSPGHISPCAVPSGQDFHSFIEYRLTVVGIITIILGFFITVSHI